MVKSFQWLISWWYLKKDWHCHVIELSAFLFLSICLSPDFCRHFSQMITIPLCSECSNSLKYSIICIFNYIHNATSSWIFSFKQILMTCLVPERIVCIDSLSRSIFYSWRCFSIRKLSEETTLATKFMFLIINSYFDPLKYVKFPYQFSGPFSRTVDILQSLIDTLRNLSLVVLLIA